MIKEVAQHENEMGALLAGILQCYGYDFSHYSHASLKRRLQRALEHARLANFTELLTALTGDEHLFDDFLRHMSVSVTEMFRDPLFYRSVRQHVIPSLKTYPFIKLWHAGCATGEEAYSMAILLQEEGFLDRASIYATDFNKQSLGIAEQGIYPARRIEANHAGYHLSGGTANLQKYYTGGYERIKFKDHLRERIIFSYHNLVTDGSFGEMNLVCCRNVLIYFDKSLQDRTLRLLTDSLRHGGFLCLGNKESLRFTAVADHFEPVDKAQRIFRKKGPLHV